MKAQYYFGVAANDDERQPDAKTKLDEAFHAANLPAKIEVYEGTLHGWCVKDMPLQNGKPVYKRGRAPSAHGMNWSLSTSGRTSRARVRHFQTNMQSNEHAMHRRMRKQ